VKFVQYTSLLHFSACLNDSVWSVGILIVNIWDWSRYCISVQRKLLVEFRISMPDIIIVQCRIEFVLQLLADTAYFS